MTRDEFRDLPVGTPLFQPELEVSVCNSRNDIRVTVNVKELRVCKEPDLTMGNRIIPGEKYLGEWVRVHQSTMLGRIETDGAGGCWVAGRGLKRCFLSREEAENRLREMILGLVSDLTTLPLMAGR